MDNENFEHLLNQAKLTKKEFAEVNDLHQGSVTN